MFSLQLHYLFFHIFSSSFVQKNPCMVGIGLTQLHPSNNTLIFCNRFSFNFSFVFVSVFEVVFRARGYVRNTHVVCGTICTRVKDNWRRM